MLEKPHKKLDLWQKSIIMVQKIYDIANSFSRNEEYGLTNQIRRSAVSIPANIAEGAARQTKKEFIRFLHMAQGSLSELDTLLEISKKLGYLREDRGKDLESVLDGIDKMLTGLIKSLKR